jgi:hypothetical protein
VPYKTTYKPDHDAGRSNGFGPESDGIHSPQEPWRRCGQNRKGYDRSAK